MIPGVYPSGDPPGFAAAADAREAALASAFSSAGITVTEVEVGSATADRPLAAERAQAAMDHARVALGPHTACAMLLSDEAGRYRWVLPAAGRPPAASPPPAHRTSRARLLTWSTEATVGLGAVALARRIEAPVRPYGFLAVAADGWTVDVPWDEIHGRRALLLLHGTFSTAEAAFHALARPENAAFQVLLAHYGGRVLAFNHPSLYATPAANAQALLRQVPEGVALDLDILTHSRGALVARELAGRAELVNPYRRDLRVGRVVFVAAPQRGTVLADGEHWQELLDRTTSLAARGPAPAFAGTVEGVVAALKLLAQGVLGGLPGLACLGPNSGYLARLNAGAAPGAAYFALSAAYTPPDDALRRRVSDAIFGEPNDGVVPTAGGHATGRVGAGFPLPPARYRVFDLGDRLYHSAFFEQEAVNGQVVAWLAEEG